MATVGIISYSQSSLSRTKTPEALKANSVTLHNSRENVACTGSPPASVTVTVRIPAVKLEDMDGS
jgi:hypothetical protein